MAVRKVPSCTYPTIQSAVDASMPGDTVWIKKGCYNEAVLIGAGKDRIRLVGEEEGKSVLEGGGIYAIGIYVSGSELVTIEQLTIRHYTVAGVFLATSYNTVKCCACEHNVQEGVWVESNAAGNLLYHVTACHNGLDGITVNGRNNMVIKCSSSRNGDNGIALKDDNNLALENVTEYNVNNGIWLANGNSCFLISNKISHNDTGIDGESNLSLLYNNEVKKSALSGFFSRGGFIHNVVLENKFKENGQGIELTSGDAMNRILSNKVEKNLGTGVHLSGGATGNVIDENHIVKNKDAGLVFDAGADNNAARSNTIKGQCPNIINNGTGNVLDDNKTC